MTIRKGSGWGTPGRLPDGAQRLGDDASLRRLVEEARRSGTAIPLVGLTGGTLWQTLGGPGIQPRLDRDDAVHHPVDVVRAELDGGTHWFVVSLVARTVAWRQAWVAMNAQWVGPYRLGHRAHPGDALLDLYEARLPVRQVLEVARRARLGAHLPHPGIQERRARTATVRFDRPRRVWLDGQAAGRTRSVTVTVEPDALTVVV